MGDKKSLRQLCELMAQKGIVAAAVNYRLANSKDISTRWPAQLDDTLLAYKWMSSHAAEYGIDPRRICAYGESAGGHIAVWLAIKEKGIACAIDGFGPMDLQSLMPRFNNALGELLGRAGLLETARLATPLYSLPKDLAPILIIQGQGDDLVPPEHSTKLYEAVRAGNGTAQLVMYPGRHSWMGVSAAVKSNIMAQVVQFVNAAPPR